MSEASERQSGKLKKKGESRHASGMFRRACRRGLMERVTEDGKRWIDEVVSNVRSIASTDRTALGLQAVKILIQQADDGPLLQQESGPHEPAMSRAMRRKTSEELDEEIAELDAEIKELQNSIVPVPATNP